MDLSNFQIQQGRTHCQTGRSLRGYKYLQMQNWGSQTIDVLATILDNCDNVTNWPKSV